MIIQAHGFSFHVDITDWGSSKGGEECAARLDAWMSRLSRDDAAEVHAFYSLEEWWECVASGPALWCHEEMSAIFLDVTSEWVNRYDSGANFGLRGL